ncbi:protealysin inhibitor emfourin [Nocardioides sp. JQ2195]|uniref:protealysin inhibitor emfourin n=1 Tax=Nocardioides sp. JQ2195 TaxID=2592334 RepID=UPI00197EFB65|nr:protealysin inhibitor emfourin [Nocardioides sp. JQ2195]
MSCHIVPPYLLAQIASAAPREPSATTGPGRPVADHCRHTLAIDERFRAARRGPSAAVEATGGFTIHTADNGSALPGRVVRESGAVESGDPAVDEAYAGLEASLEMFAQVYDRDSWDGRAARVLATVHYEHNYDNAFWDGTQLVFGDGDGEVFDRFTKPIDVLAHELTHAVTESVAGLVYQGQSGALNESVSDVFAACLKQRVRGQSAAEADWLVGEGLFLPGVSARGLRDMASPGTAYDDPVLGKDPQGADMSAYVETTDDNGGVHLNSGIPNRAFVLAARAIGGSSAEGAGRIWWAALSAVSAEVDFAGFADATVQAAGDHADAVRDAWDTVGVAVSGESRGKVPGGTGGDVPGGEPDGDVPGGGPGGEPGGEVPGGGTGGEVPGGGTGGDVPGGGPGGDVPGGGPGGDVPGGRAAVVEVRRTGGFTGRAVSGRCDLSGQGAHVDEVRSLLDRVDLRATKPGRGYPDMYSYVIRVGDTEVTLAEPQMTDDLRRLATLVLEDRSDPTS